MMEIIESGLGPDRMSGRAEMVLADDTVYRLVLTCV